MQLVVQSNIQTVNIAQAKAAHYCQVSCAIVGTLTINSRLGAQENPNRKHRWLSHWQHI
jgi:hypothetical protein